MARLGNIQEYEKRKAAATPVGTSPQSQSVREGFQQMAQKPMEQPVLQKVDANKVYESTRSQALGSDAAQVDPQKTMESWNASPYEYWTEQVKTNPESTYAIVNQMFASKETPEEKAKRERREQLGEVFNNLGNLIGNAANLYYTHRGGQYIDLNTANEKHRERMQRIKDKQDALDRQREQIILNAKLGDAKTARAEAVAAKKADADAKAKDLQYKRDLALKQIDNAFKLGQIDAQTAANMKRDVAKAKSDKELESFKQTNRIIYKQTPSYEDLNGDKKKSTYTYGGTEYNKKDLSSMVNLYNKLKEDGYALPNIKGKHLNQYVDAIANLMGKGTWNMGEFAPAEQNVPDIVDSDIVSSNAGAEKWKPDYDEEWTSK